jgi:holin-like protein
MSEKARGPRYALAVRISTQLFVLWLIFRAGEWIVARLHVPIPGNMLGMVLLFLLLSLGMMSEEWLQDGAAILTKHLAFFFIPIAVGLMQWGGLFRRDGHWLLLALGLSTFATLFFTGAIAQRLGQRHTGRSRWHTSQSSPAPSRLLPARTPSPARRS